MWHPRRPRERQRDDETASVSGLAGRLHPDAAAVLLDDPLADGQAQAQASEGGSLRTAEALEDGLLALARDANTAIGDRDLDVFALGIDRDLDLPSLRRVADRVGDQVVEHLLDAVAIGEDRQMLRRAHGDAVLVPGRL